MPRVLNYYRDAIPAQGAVWIMRGSKWGNPYKIGVDGTREEVIEKYKRYLLRSGLLSDIEELRGKDLICCCKPKPCHGDLLLAAANPDTLP